MHSAEYGTFKLGRLTYRTAQEARAVAEELGLSDVHSQDMSGEVVFMPGRDMDALNQRLREMGMQAAAPASARRRSSGGDMFADLGIGMGMGNNDDDLGGGLL